MSVKFDRAHRLFYPQVPAILAANIHDTVAAMPLVSYSWVSDSPPMLGASVSPKSFTYKVILKARAFTVNLLDQRMAANLGLLSSLHGQRRFDKLKAAGIEHVRAKRVAAPAVSGAAAVIECDLARSTRTGDHVLLLGLVRACWARNFDESWDFKKYNPILYTGWMGTLTTYNPVSRT